MQLVHQSHSPGVRSWDPVVNPEELPNSFVLRWLRVLGDHQAVGARFDHHGLEAVPVLGHHDLETAVWVRPGCEDVAGNHHARWPVEAHPAVALVAEELAIGLVLEAEEAAVVGAVPGHVGVRRAAPVAGRDAEVMVKGCQCFPRVAFDDHVVVAGTGAKHRPERLDAVSHLGVGHGVVVVDGLKVDRHFCCLLMKCTSKDQSIGLVRIEEERISQRE